MRDPKKIAKHNPPISRPRRRGGAGRGGETLAIATTASAASAAPTTLKLATVQSTEEARVEPQPLPAPAGPAATATSQSSLARSTADSYRYLHSALPTTEIRFSIFNSTTSANSVRQTSAALSATASTRITVPFESIQLGPSEAQRSIFGQQQRDSGAESSSGSSSSSRSSSSRSNSRAEAEAEGALAIDAVATVAIRTPPSTPKPLERSNTMQAEDGSIPPETSTVAAGIPATTTESVGKDVAPFLSKHIPEQYASAPLQDDSKQGNTKYCYRHRPDVKCRRQADEVTMESLQKQLETLPHEDQQAITHMWNIFSAAPATHRTIMLQGILNQCCFPQLSFISAALRDLIRIDFLTALPPELAFKILSYLDTASLCKAAQVSQKWRMLADDDVVWHKMCEQHIDRKCDKCGWGLPLLERKRILATKRQIQIRAASMSSEMLEATNGTSRLNIHGKRAGDSGEGEASGTPTKKLRYGDGVAGSSSEESYFDLMPKRRPWKDVYCERFKVESNWRRGRCTTRIFKGHTNGIICLQFDDSILATGSYDTTIKIWDIETGQEVRALTGHTLGVRCLQFDDRMLISGSMDNTLKIWNYRTGNCLRTLDGHTAGVICLHFDLNVLVSGSVDNTIIVWNFTDKSRAILRGHTDWVNSVRYHASSRTVFSASDDMTVKIWDLDNRICVRTFEGHVGQVQQVLPIELSQYDIAGLFNSDDNKAGDETVTTGQTSGDDTNTTGSPSVVPPPPMSPLASPPSTYTLSSPPHASSSSSATPSFAAPRGPTPSYILTAALDATVKLWDVHTGKCLKTLFGHVEGIWALAADNLRVVTGAQDRMVKVWDIRTGRCERTITGHNAAVSCLALSDSRLVTGSEDCEARMYCFKNASTTGGVVGVEGEMVTVVGESWESASSGSGSGSVVGGAGALASHVSTEDEEASESQMDEL